MKKSSSVLAVQSKEWILLALLDIMNRKEYKSITVKEIAARAGVDRKTFYRNFKTKEDVLRFYIHGACQEYIAKLEHLDTRTTYTISKIFFTICQKHMSFFSVLEEHHLLTLLLSAFDELLPEINKHFESSNTTYCPLYNSEYVLAYYTGGFWNISTKWIRNGAKEPPEEMAGLVEKLISSLR